MQVKENDLESHLSQKLAPIYLISGDETLLVEEACDAVLKAARQAGFTERSVHHVETGFKWSNLRHDAASMSLFAEKKVLDVRIPAKRFDREGSEALREWVEQIDPQGEIESILLLRTGRLDGNKRKAAWFKALDKLGVITLIWPLPAGQLPRWLSARMKSRGLSANAEAVQYLADRVEGNLLAAAQEVEKLGLQDLPQPITLETLVSSLEDTSRFTSFDLLDAMMVGNAARLCKILSALKEEGVALFAILGALTSQVRRMHHTVGMPPAKQKIVSQFARRIRDSGPVLAECAIIDQQGKGQLRGDPWVALERLLLRLAGVRAVTLPSQDQQIIG